ncbi:hypothetical protein FRUB_01411 [Fimbriiglobus ruber]|uniref:Uncharacterized protein n=1 Tax=Fimbriiglobus ruber TaxID=1908690 RepID=A0A225DU80_9BACT|nr:hypothetical protein FRUB_01411 [Fimbriiglobus ruber]
MIVGGAIGAGGPAAAQTTQSVTISPNLSISMPGTPVGQPLVMPVGAQISKAVPQAGAKVGTGPGGVPDMLNPKLPVPNGQMLNLSNVIGPYPNMPGAPSAPPTFWDKLEQRWMNLFKSDQPAERNNWTPGLARRNKARQAAAMMPRD